MMQKKIKMSPTGMQKLDAFIVAQSEIATIGDGSPDHAFPHPSVFRALLQEVGAKVELDNYAVSQTLSFSGLTLQGDTGEIRIIPDRYALYNAVPVITLDSWELGSMGKAIDIFDRESDQEMLREASADAYELRVGGYLNLACHAPGHNGRLSVDLVA